MVGPLGPGKFSNFYSEREEKSLDQVYALERSLLQLKAICGSAQTKDLPFPELFFYRSVKLIGAKNSPEKRNSLVPRHVVVQSLSHVRLRKPMDCSLPGFPVLHYLQEFAQTHVY